MKQISTNFIVLMQNDKTNKLFLSLSIGKALLQALFHLTSMPDIYRWIRKALLFTKLLFIPLFSFCYGYVKRVIPAAKLV